MKTSDQGLTLLMQREGEERVAYPDPKSALFRACAAAGIKPYDNGYRNLDGWENLSGDPWTAGVGHASGVKPGDVWSDDQIKQVFTQDVARFEEAVNDCVKVPLTQYQFDALVSFSVNCGPFALAHGGNHGGASSILRALNAGDYDGAANAFNNWMADAILRTRRAAEREQFKGTKFIARLFDLADHSV